MKKILLSMILICAFAIANAQVVCGEDAIRRWDGTGQPGDMGLGRAGTGGTNLFTINGSSADWIEHIVGPYAYAGAPKGGYEPDPHTSPEANGNVQLDGLRSATGSNYDRDVPGQDHRDLRYFAFTYDRANVYFYFRRPKNNTAQVSLYYFVDINVDGYMKTGEPVIKVTFNNSGSEVEMGWYEAVNSNGIAAGSYDPVKGNLMSATTTRVKVIPNTSEWAIGSADGWNMPGVYHELGNNVNLPTLTTINGIMEVFNAATLVDTHPDGTEAGYGVEFAVPFRYLGLYTASGLTAGTAITYASIFTWHVSLGSGNSGIDGAEDNAGGCCSGLALSGAPIVTKSATWAKTGADGYNYRLTINFINGRNYQTKMVVASIKVVNPRDVNGIPLPESVVSNWTATGYRTATGCVGTDAQVDPIGFAYDGVTIAFNNVTMKNDTTFLFSSNDLSKSYKTLAGNIGAAGCYFVHVYALGFPPLGSATVSYQYEASFDIQSQTCGDIENAPSEGALDVLPVKFTYFNAARSGANVNLTWQTATENKNKGFEIQRFIGAAGGWETIGFVGTQASNGNSNSQLNYQFTDLNNTVKGISQYRLKQVDVDNRAAFSVIRSVRGQGQKGKTIVYPNPSNDGKVSIIFEDVSGTRDVSVTDMSGRVIKQMRGLTNNNIVIENLTAGMYTVKIVNNETGDQEVQKFVVNKR